jgi:hypothetical protein
MSILYTFYDLFIRFQNQHFQNIYATFFQKNVKEPYAQLLK